MNVSVVVATCNRPADLHECLRSVGAQSQPAAETFVVDASAMSCAHVVDSFAGQMPLRYDHRPGLTPPESRNIGIDQASHDLVLFIDDDAVADRRWIEQMIELACQYPDATLVSGRLVHVPAASPYSLLIDALRAHRYDLAGTDAVVYPNLPNCLVRRDRLRALEVRFDERMVREEDIDLALQIRARGGQIVLAGEATVFHRVRPTFWAFLKQRFQNSGNRARLRLKWPAHSFHVYGSRRRSYVELYWHLLKASYEGGGVRRALGLTGLIAASVLAYEAGNLYYNVGTARVRMGE